MILVVTSQHPEWGESNITENIICCCCWWWWFLVLEKTTSSPREQKSLRQKWDKEIGVPWILHKYRTRWWFHVVLIFNPTRGNDPIWLIFFQMGWNHRLDEQDDFTTPWQSQSSGCWKLFRPSPTEGSSYVYLGMSRTFFEAKQFGDIRLESTKLVTLVWTWSKKVFQNCWLKPSPFLF